MKLWFTSTAKSSARGTRTSPLPKTFQPHECQLKCAQRSLSGWLCPDSLCAVWYFIYLLTPCRKPAWSPSYASLLLNQQKCLHLPTFRPDETCSDGWSAGVHWWWWWEISSHFIWSRLPYETCLKSSNLHSAPVQKWLPKSMGELTADPWNVLPCSIAVSLHADPGLLSSRHVLMVIVVSRHQAREVKFDLLPPPLWPATTPPMGWFRTHQ